MSHDLSADTWLDQATRDLEAAEHLLAGGYSAHATVLAHLAVEKALKAVFKAQLDENPPVTHDLRYLAGRVHVPWSQDHWDALGNLSDVSILSLYAPDAPFGHPVSDRADAARQRVSDARMLVGRMHRHVDSAGS
jgi:HEPN domain-containing protein